MMSKFSGAEVNVHLIYILNSQLKPSVGHYLHCSNISLISVELHFMVNVMLYICFLN